MCIYIIGSMRNPAIPVLAQKIRELGIDVFDDWYSPGPEADDYWQKYEKDRGRSYKESLNGFHAKTVFSFDHYHLNRATSVVLVMPAGRSAHLELGWAIGKGKKGYVLFDKEPERYDIMYQFATDIFFSEKDLIDELSRAGSQPPIDTRERVAEPLQYSSPVERLSWEGYQPDRGCDYDGIAKDRTD